MLIDEEAAIAFHWMMDVMQTVGPNIDKQRRKTLAKRANKFALEQESKSEAAYSAFGVSCSIVADWMHWYEERASGLDSAKDEAKAE